MKGRDHAWNQTKSNRSYQEATRNIESPHSTPKQGQRLVRRAKIILAASDQRNNKHNADLLGVMPTTVQIWIERWNLAADALEKAEADENEKSLSEGICNVLADDPRPGRPANFSLELICQIIAVA